MKILVIDDHPFVRQGIISILSEVKGYEVVGETDEANSALSLISDNMPDVVLIDLSLKGNINGLDLIKAIKERYPKVKSIAVSMHDENVYAERAIRAGALGYIMKGEDPEKLINAIEKVFDGEIAVSKKVSDKIMNKFFHGANNVEVLSVELFSNRELEVFELIGHGFSTSEIAQKLGLSISTIETYRANIKDKLNLKNAAELTKTAVQWVIEKNRI
ncbi:MAG: response regulator transcription factor [Spirochaetes bacterium]|nr:response regulator transcription factor [Spirochaetota bacterium]